MTKYILIAAIALGLQGCAAFNWGKDVKGISIVKQERERTPLNLPNPQPLKPTPPQWIVITPENQAQVFESLQKQGIDPVLFGITDDGYERLSVDTANTRNYIDALRRILEEYRRYYEPAKKDEQSNAK
jgi:hypothetical protein